MRGQMALTLGLLGCLSAGCWEDSEFQGYGLENRRNHPLKISVRSAVGCRSQVDLGDPDSFGKAVTKTLEPGDIVELESFESASLGARDSSADGYPYYGRCGAVWLSLPDHDYEAVLAWDEDRGEYFHYAADTWRYALVVEGTKENVAVHVPSEVRELEAP